MWRIGGMVGVRGLAALVLVACGGAQSPAADAEPADPLAAANAAFRSLYAENRLERLAHSGSALVVQFDDLLLFRDGAEVRRERFTPALYHDLKGIAHFPLGVVVVYSNAVERPDGTWRSELTRLGDAFAAVDDGFLQARFPPDLVDDQRQLVHLSRDFIATELAREQPDGARLRSYAEATHPILMRNADRAAREQLDGLHHLVQAWRAEMGEAAWTDIFVVVLGPKTPRVGNLQFEYFAYAMGREAAGDRLVYAEGMFDPEPAVQLMGTLLQDRAAADLFFGDPFRLERDLLADAAAAHLQRLFGEVR